MRHSKPQPEDDQTLRAGCYWLGFEFTALVTLLLFAFGWGFSLVLLGGIIFIALVELLRRKYARRL